MFKPFFCIILLFIFSISVVPVLQIIYLFQQDEMFDDSGDEQTSLIKLIKKTDDCINNIHINTSFKLSQKVQHNLKDEQFPFRFFDDIVTPPPDL